MAQGPYWRPSQAVLKRPPIPIQDKTNAELAQKFSEWLVAQRYLKVAQHLFSFSARRLMNATRRSSNCCMRQVSSCRVCEDSSRGDVDFKRRTIRVAGKGKERTVFFGKSAATAVKSYLAGRKKGSFLFHLRSPRADGSRVFVLTVSCLTYNTTTRQARHSTKCHKFGSPRDAAIRLKLTIQVLPENSKDNSKSVMVLRTSVGKANHLKPCFLDNFWFSTIRPGRCRARTALLRAA